MYDEERYTKFQNYTSRKVGEFPSRPMALCLAGDRVGSRYEEAFSCTFGSKYSAHALSSVDQRRGSCIGFKLRQQG